MSKLVDALCNGQHPVEVSLRPSRTCQRLKEGIDRGYVHLKFTDTKGGTEIGIRLDMGLTQLDRADFDRGAGRIRLIGTLTLDYVRVRAVADIDLATFCGTGFLERAVQ